jgi:hypothetical protein
MQGKKEIAGSSPAMTMKPPNRAVFFVLKRFILDWPI